MGLALRDGPPLTAPLGGVTGDATAGGVTGDATAGTGVLPA